MPQKLSVAITTHNNENKIKATLESIKWADEIIIVDGRSTDNTVKICKQYTDKIYIEPNHAQWNINKNFGFKKASGDWILNLDSDEIVKTRLTREIRRILSEGTEYDYFYIPRREYYFGKWIKSIWGPEPLHVKLFRKGAAEYECRHLHEPITASGEKARLKGHIKHNAYVNISELMGRIGAFTDEEAKCMQKEGFNLKLRHFITRPGQYVFYAYIKKGGFKNGVKELIAILLWCGYYQFLTLIKLAKLKKGKNDD